MDQTTHRTTLEHSTLRFSTSPLQVIGTSVWPAFLWAGVASLLFFATFDPMLLGEVATYKLPLSRSAGYTLGFFGFWFLGIANNLSTQFLMGHVRIEPNNPQKDSPTATTQTTDR